MRLAAFGDIHSNSIAFRACFEKAKRAGFDACLLLGDFVSDCAYPERTMELIRDIQSRFPTFIILGNREEYLLGHMSNPSSPWRCGSRTGSLLYTYENLSSESLQFFSSLKIAEKISFGSEPSVEIAHGSLTESRGHILPGNAQAEKAFFEMETDYLFCAHTHTQFIVQNGSKLIANGGTVGLPAHGEKSACFLMLESKSGKWIPSLERAPYDHDAVVREIGQSALIHQAPRWARAVIASLKTGRNYPFELVKLTEKIVRKTKTSMDDESAWIKAAEILGI